MRTIMMREPTSFADRVTYDDMGFVIAQQGSTSPKVMLNAHIDDLGDVARRVTLNGFLSVQMLGNGSIRHSLISARLLSVTRAPFMPRPAFVIPRRSCGRTHESACKRQPAPGRRGHTAAEVEALGLSPGDPVGPDAPFKALPSDRYLGKAWDDRVGCAIVHRSIAPTARYGPP